MSAAERARVTACRGEGCGARIRWARTCTGKAPGWSMRSLWHQPEDGSEAELKATLLAEACGGEWVESIDDGG